MLILDKQMKMRVTHSQQNLFSVILQYIWLIVKGNFSSLEEYFHC